MTMGMSNRTRLTIDAVLLAGLLIAFFPARTGISTHEWLSVALVVPALFHLVINWDWVMRTSGRLFAKLRTTSTQLKPPTSNMPKLGRCSKSTRQQLLTASLWKK